MWRCFWSSVPSSSRVGADQRQAHAAEGHTRAHAAELLDQDHVLLVVEAPASVPDGPGRRRPALLDQPLPPKRWSSRLPPPPARAPVGSTRPTRHRSRRGSPPEPTWPLLLLAGNSQASAMPAQNSTTQPYRGIGPFWRRSGPMHAYRGRHRSGGTFQPHRPSRSVQGPARTPSRMLPGRSCRGHPRGRRVVQSPELPFERGDAAAQERGVDAHRHVDGCPTVAPPPTQSTTSPRHTWAR